MYILYCIGYGTQYKCMVSDCLCLCVFQSQIATKREVKSKIYLSKVNFMFCHFFVGKLTIVVGQVGSGKSSFLSAILGEMTTLRGTVKINRYV